MFKVGQKVKSTRPQNPFEGGTLYGIVIDINDTNTLSVPKYVIQSALVTSQKGSIGRTEASLADATKDPDFPEGQEVKSILEKLKLTGGRRKYRKTKKARRTRRRRRNTRRN